MKAIWDSATTSMSFTPVNCREWRDLEPGISKNQTDEMKSKRLQLGLPQSLHETYRESQREWLMNIAEFVQLISDRQRANQ